MENLKFLYNTEDKKIVTYTTNNQDQNSISDFLQNSYVNDVVLNYKQFNEVYQILVDVWEFLSDEFVTTNTLSDEVFQISDQTNNQMVKYQMFLLDNNIPQENKPSTSVYIKHNCKIVFKNESDKKQTEIQSESNLSLTYFLNVFPNTYLIKQGDIIKDPIDPDDFWYISNIEEKHILYDKITSEYVKIYNLNASRINLTTTPIQLWNEYFQGQEHPKFINTTQKVDYNILEGDLSTDSNNSEEIEIDYENGFNFNL